MNPEFRHRLRSYPGFYSAMALLAALALIAAALFAQEQARWRRAGRALEGGRRELEKASAAANAEVEIEVAALKAELDRGRAALFGAAPEVQGAVPAGRIEAYSDLKGFVERSRAGAARAGVAVAADERFGFGRYAREGPALDDVPVVWKQRVATERLLEALWAARPQALSGVCVGKDAAAGWSGERSLGVPGLVAADRCDLAFIGETSCLRRYLPVLAGLADPVVVIREVRVEPVPLEGRRVHGVPRNKFSLALELLHPVGPAVSATDVGPRVDVPTWAAPRAQSAGGGWVFEVFDSPAIEYAKDRRDWLLVGAGAAAVVARSDRGDVELVEVRRLPYRWRLVGHGGAGSGAGGWVVLEDTVSGRTVRLRRGERDAAGAITLEEWRLVRTSRGEQVSEAQLLGADAVVRQLRAGVATPGTELAAVLREGRNGAPVEAIAGATVQVGASEYRIDGVEETSAQVSRLNGRAKPGERLRLERVRE